MLNRYYTNIEVSINCAVYSCFHRPKVITDGLFRKQEVETSFGNEDFPSVSSEGRITLCYQG
jgi:hypothetical protein